MALPEKKPIVHDAASAEQKKKLYILVALAFIIIVIIWIGLWKWAYHTEGPDVGSLIQTVSDDISPGLKQLDTSK